jgi:hypothetical protein
MQSFNVPNLNEKTPQAEQTKLVNALKAVNGVDAATLQPSKHSFEIRGKGQQNPKREDITAAASKAGFAVDGKK